MSRRITKILTIVTRVESASRDRYGNPIVTTVRVPWPVWTVAPGVGHDDTEPNRSAVTKGRTVYAPTEGPAPTEHDAVEVDGVPFEVIGDVQRWEGNPHPGHDGHDGLVVTLQRKDG